MSNDPRTSKPAQPGRPDPSDPQRQGQPIEVPGRPDADRDTDRDKAYGPGGGKPKGTAAGAGGRDAAPAEPDQGAQDPNQSAPTGRGADTKPL
jgi:hypothetical protein